MVSAGIVKINGVDPNTYISNTNDSYWVIMNDRRVSWTDTIPKAVSYTHLRAHET